MLQKRHRRPTAYATKEAQTQSLCYEGEGLIWEPLAILKIVQTLVILMFFK